MQCGKCGGKGDVVDSRPQGADIWRRRQCRACGERWTTVEAVTLTDELRQATVVQLNAVIGMLTNVKEKVKQSGSRPS